MKKSEAKIVYPTNEGRPDIPTIRGAQVQGEPEPHLPVEVHPRNIDPNAYMQKPRAKNE